MKKAGYNTLDSASPHRSIFPAAEPVTVAAVYSPHYHGELYAISGYFDIDSHFNSCYR